jgi:chemotaxis protein CheD
MVTHIKSTLVSTTVRGQVELMPGDLAIGDSGDQMKTLLGSCVTVILTDPRRTVGAMCHIVHVGKPNAANVHNTAFGSVAMHDMFARLRAKGVNPGMCEAYVFGGGNMFPDIFSAKHVGSSNSEWVLDYLHAHHIPVVDHCLGGNGYRKVSWTVGLTDPLVETVFAEQGKINDR